MTDLERMAREAHRQLVTHDYPGHLGQLDPWTMRLLARFADLIRADERERCASLCDAQVAGSWGCPEEAACAQMLAAAIRA